MPAHYATRCHAGLQANRKQKTRAAKKHVVKKQKKKGKDVSADMADDNIADDTVLQGQQQVLGDLYQATFRSLRLDAVSLLDKPGSSNDRLPCYSMTVSYARHCPILETLHEQYNARLSSAVTADWLLTKQSVSLGMNTSK